MVFIKEIKDMFWGVTLDGGKRYTQCVDRGFHISMAALEPSTGKKQAVSVMVQHDKAEFMICTLEYGRVYQQALDLYFTEDEEVTFFLNAEGIVHLTGYLTDMGESDDDMEGLGMDEEMSSEELEEDSDDDEEEDDYSSPDAGAGNKRKSLISKAVRKKLKMSQSMGQDEDSDEDSDDDDFILNEAEDVSDDDDEDEDVEEEEEEEEEDSDSPVPKKSNKKSQELNKSKSNKKKEKSTEKSPKQNGDPVGPGGDVSETKKKKKKKKKKATDTPETPAESQTASEAKSKKKVLAGGTLAEDVKQGHGTEAKPGKMVHVYYTGRLANSGKQFDSVSSGKPFKFRLGKNEVISGWDTGVNGMKVGGKRKLTVPANQGYGNQRQGPIPPNSTLIFDVELKAVS